MNIGVLALQGDFREHVSMLKKIGIHALEIRTKEQLNSVDALIIPGGESTTIGKLIKKHSLDESIKRAHSKGMPIYGTCAGAILLAKDIIDSDQPRLGLADISIQRNSYGRQIDSFEADIDIEGLKNPFHAVFIRAPQIKEAGNSIKILARHKGTPVLIRQDNILISTFHPELTDDTRVHEYFVKMIDKK